MEGDLTPFCTFIEDYSKAVAETGDEFVVVYPLVCTVLKKVS